MVSLRPSGPFFVLAAACAGVLCASASPADAADATPASLASGGEAQMPVVVSADASERVRSAAESLCNYLGRISGAEFALHQGDGSGGIVVGLPENFASVPFEVKIGGGPSRREEYVLRSSEDGLWLLGATELAVEHAVWDALYRLGYRQFFPGETWEVVPEKAKLELAVDVVERPDFYSRRIWYGHGMRWGYNQEPYNNWCARNRMGRGFQLSSGHSYYSIVAARPEEFEKHPEYYALVDGERKEDKSTKFCISNPGLRELVVDVRMEDVRRNPDVDSVSMDPSDGAGWCECAPCKELGSPSDRAVMLANAVAEAINKLGLGEKYVGMYAYNLHSPPPSIEVHPNIIVSVATGFMRGGYTVDQIIEGWHAKGATLGIRDYFSVTVVDMNLPRVVGELTRAARTREVAARIKEYRGKGARFYNAESGDTWGPHGLSYYVASRVMWDVDEADRYEQILDDFLARAFGPAREPMEEFYHLINADTQRRSSADLVGRMYRHLDRARELAADRPDVQRRIDDLILYTRYVELYNQRLAVLDDASATGEAKEKATARVVAHAYRIRETMLVHAYAIFLIVGQKAAEDPDHPYKDDRPFTEAEIRKILREGIAANQPVEVNFEPVEFSDNLVPAARRLGLPAVPPGSFPTEPESRHKYYIWVDRAPAEVHLKVTVEEVWKDHHHEITLYSPKEGGVEPVDRWFVDEPGGKSYDVKLQTPYSGLHRVTVRDGGDYTRIEWPEGTEVTVPTGIDTADLSHQFRGPWTLYFYVPKGTKVVGGWAAKASPAVRVAPRISGVLRDAGGNVRLDFGTLEDGWFSVTVPEGQDGRLWKFENNHEMRRLVTVPPYVARSAEELLLPAEVVERDAE